jgi:hypothetical protein
MCSCANLPITKKVSPIPRKENAVNDLCFLKPKHKLVIPNIAEIIRRIHSNSSVANKDNPKIGNNVITKGIIIQCTAQVILAIIPALSNIFLTQL